MHIIFFIIISQNLGCSVRQIDLFANGINIGSVSNDKNTSLQSPERSVEQISVSGNTVGMAYLPRIGKKNPNTALLLSILPGGGQFYTHNYLKGAVFVLLQGVAAGATIYFWTKENKAKEENNSPDADYYYGQMYNCLWIDGFVWGFSMMDAYVSAHFYKFRDQSTASGLEIGFRL
ncbi:MAG: hypothetical protein PHE49_05950 [bacterium]|nr:hypothetical protein [bacterium]